MTSLRRVYGSVLLFQQFQAACDELAPQNAALHSAAYDAFARKHSISRIEQFFSVTPNPVPKVDGVRAGMKKIAPKILAQVAARPETCTVLGALFEQMVSKQVGPAGITNLGAYFDGLLAQANLAPPSPATPSPAPPSPAPGATAQAPAVIVPQSPAKPAEGQSKKGKIETLADVYEAAFAIPRFQKICDDIVPEQAALHKAAVDAFSTKHSFERIRAYFAASRDKFPWIEASDTKIEQGVGKVRAAFTKKPEACSILPLVFKSMVEKKGEVQDLGVFFDGLVSGAKATTPPSAPADVIAPVDESAAPKAVQPDQMVVAAAATTGGLAMPTAIRDKVKQLPGLSWTMPDGVRSGSGHCVWRCSAYAVEKGDSRYPWLIIHEAVPLPAEQAIDAVLAGTKRKKEITGKKPIPADAFGASMPMKPDRTVVMNVHYTDRGSSSDKERRRVMFGFEKGGLSVVAEWHYPRLQSPEKTRKNELILGTMMRSIRMDTAAVEASLRAPLPASIGMVKGAPPGADQVIYAERPNYHMNSLTLSGYYDDDARYLDKAVFGQQGPVIKIKGSTPYYYVPPHSDGATIEGAFKSSDGYFNMGVSVLKTSLFIFGHNGRYSTSSGSGVTSTSGWGLANKGSSSGGEGSYRISGYTLELQPDNGPAKRMAFFPYYSKVFWPGSDAPDGKFNFINMGGKVMFRNDD
ncbi:MAG: hypothetical protein ACR2PM_09460 [Hyphomicrobiales bacterium]